MDEATAHKVWDVLVETAGAHERGRDEFVYHQTRKHPPTEYRFQGLLGFGGKFWSERARWRVTAYPEDMTPERKTIIEQANAALAELKTATNP